MRSTRWLLGLLVLAALPVAGCGDSAPKVCDSCRIDADCDQTKGHTCGLFTDGRTQCVSSRATTCPR